MPPPRVATPLPRVKCTPNWSGAAMWTLPLESSVELPAGPRTVMMRALKQGGAAMWALPLGLPSNST